jgi:hypothetical protein
VFHDKAVSDAHPITMVALDGVKRHRGPDPLLLSEPIILSQISLGGLSFLPFLPMDTKGEEEEWSTASNNAALQYINSDLSLLLRLPFAHFLGHLLYNKGLKKLVDYYLRYGERPFDREGGDEGEGKGSSGGDDSLTGDMKERSRLQYEVSRRVMMIFVRLGGNEYHELERVSPPFCGVSDNYGSLLYDNWIIDAAKIFDLAALYSQVTVEESESYKAAVVPPDMADSISSKRPYIMQQVFLNFLNLQPALYDDLSESVKILMKVVSEIQTRAEGSHDTPLTKDLALDLEAYLFDITMSCSTLVHLLPQQAHYFFLPDGSSVNTNIVLSLAAIYDVVIPQLATCSTLHRAKKIRSHIIQVIHALLSSKLWRSNSTAVKANGDLIEFGYQLISKLVTLETDGRRLLRDYHQRHDVVTGLSTLGVDEARLSYIKDVLAALGTPPADPSFSLDPVDMGVLVSSEESVLLGASAQIRDLFPDLSYEFIAQCLKEYSNNTEAVVNALFEGSLPSHLEAQRRPFMPFDKESANTTILSNETKSAALSTIFLSDGERAAGMKVEDAWRGKKDIELGADDELHMKLKRAFGSYDEYGDDYDDSYEPEGYSQQGIADKGGEDLDNTKFVLKRNLNHSKHAKTEAEALLLSLEEGEVADGEDGEGEEGDGAEGDSAESKVSSEGGQASHRGRGRGRGGGRGGGGGSGSSRRTASGVAPSKKDAAFKDKNKAVIGNHNRKRGADKKMRAVGMMM